MKFRIMRWKYETGSYLAQAESKHLRTYVYFFTGATLLLANSPVVAQTTSALEILQQAPTVRFEDPTPVPAPPQQPVVRRTPDAVPYRPPAGPAPYVEPVYPAITPYNGNRVGAPRPSTQPGLPDPQMPPPPGLPEVGASETPVPPVLGPEDVGGRKEKKRGFFRGMINAIPFVGDDEEEEARFTPVPTARIATPPPMVEEPFSDEEPRYRGYEALTDGNEPQPGEPLLLPPASTPYTRSLPPDPTPSSPPIMTPTPRGGLGVSPDVQPLDTIDQDRPVLTVKREGEETTATEPGDVKIAPAEAEPTKAPAVSGSEDITIQPRSKAISPIDLETTAVSVEEVPPRALSPDQTVQTPAVNPAEPNASAVETTPAEEDVATSLTVEQSDLGMPNPTYEQNSVILGEFQEAVRKARAEDYATAAQMFRDYGFNHPSSGLAPRAFFLSVVFEKDRAKARESVEALERLFPESNYVKQVKERRPDVFGNSSASPAIEIASAVTDETPQQKIDRLEKELTAAVGDPVKEPALRSQLGAAYLELEENDRAWEVLRPAVEMTADSAEQGKVLMLLARVHMARGEVTKALELIDIVEQKFPGAVGSDAKSAWSAGLAYEAGARYNKARAIYNELRLKWPNVQEARWAELRLRDLAALNQ